MKPVLLIDTATERGIVSIFDQETQLFHADLPYGLNNSKHLLPKIQEGLLSLGLEPKDLHCIACGTGPGSYTGMRVGAMTAKTLSFALEIPLVGVSTLQGFIPEKDDVFGVLIDAKVAGAYILIGEKNGSNVQYLTSPQVQTIEECADLLKEVPHIVTPKGERLRGRMEEVDPSANWTWEEMWPNPSHFARLAWAKFEAGEYTVDGSLELLYLR